MASMWPPLHANADNFYENLSLDVSVLNNLYADACKCCHQGHYEGNLVYRQNGDTLLSALCKMRRGGVMMWGGVSHVCKSEHVIINSTMNAERYRDEIITTHVEQSLNHHSPNLILKQDNAGPHIARVIMDHLGQQQIKVLPRPAVLTDISSNDHYWDKQLADELQEDGTTFCYDTYIPISDRDVEL